MNRRSCAALVLGLAFALTLTSTAHAAKGVKKNKAHTIRGTVVAVHHKKGTGTVTIRTQAHRAKKKTAVANANKAKTAQPHDVTIHIDQATAYTLTKNKAQAPATLAHLHHGAKVAVQTTGQHADNVQIHVPNQGAARAKKAKKKF